MGSDGGVGPPLPFCYFSMSVFDSGGEASITRHKIDYDYSVLTVRVQKYYIFVSFDPLDHKSKSTR